MATEGQMSDRKAGCVMILCNKLDNSRIHEEHAEKMRQLWKDEVGCELFQEKTHLNVNDKEMRQLFRDLSKKDASKYDYLVVVICAEAKTEKTRSGRGDKAPKDFLARCVSWLRNRLPTNETYGLFIEGRNHTKFSEDKMFSYFYNDKSQWKGKSKMFILNYRRRWNSPIEHTPKLRYSRRRRHGYEVLKNQPNTDTGAMSYPRISDFLVTNSQSSSFIDDIYEVFHENWQNKKVIDTLTMVNAKIAKEQELISIFESSVTDTFTLHPISGDEPQASPAPSLVRHLASLHQNPNLSRAELERRIMTTINESTSEDKMALINVDKYLVPDTKIPSKGCALIICNEIKPQTDYHTKDQRKMLRLWRDTLQCDMFQDNAYINQTAAQMRALLKQLSDLPLSQPRPYAYVVVIISCHGGLNKTRIGNGIGSFRPFAKRPVFCGFDGNAIEEQEMFSYFVGAEWSEMMKIFILDYCRGPFADQEVTKAEPIGDDDADNNGAARCPHVSSVLKNSIVVHATHPKHLAFTDGLINRIHSIFGENWEQKSVQDMLTLVNREMRKFSTNGIKAMSVFKSTATKDFFLYDH